MHPFRLALCLAPTTLLFAAGTANAATCEEAFVKKGNPITGLRFTAAVTVADLPPAVAIGQMRGLVAAQGYDIMADEAEYGSMLIEQPMTGNARAFPIQISATQTGGFGTVVMDAKLRAAQSVKADAAMAEMCGMLNQIKGGKAGRRGKEGRGRDDRRRRAGEDEFAELFAAGVEGHRTQCRGHSYPLQGQAVHD